MRLLARGTFGTGRSRGLLCLVAAWAAAAACDQKTSSSPVTPVVPMDSDPRPATPSPLLIFPHRLNDSMYSIEYTVSDTTPFVKAFSGVEAPESPNVMPSPLSSFHVIVESTTFAPPRYNVHRTDTLAPRSVPGYYQLNLVTQYATARVPWWRYSRVYFGSTSLTMMGSPIPDAMHQVGLEFSVSPRGQYPLRAMRALLDSGTSAQQSVGPLGVDSVLLTGGDINRDFHFWIRGPLESGQHTLSVTAVDSVGRAVTWRKSFVNTLDSRAYHVTPITYPDAADVRANAINNLGVIAMRYVMPDSTTRAVTWRAGAFTVLPGAVSSSADAISDSGYVSGYITRLPNSAGNASAPDSIVVWYDGVLTPITKGFGWLSSPAVANDGATLVSPHAIYRRGVMTDLPMFEARGMNNPGWAVGYIFDIGPPTTAVAMMPDYVRVPQPYNVGGPQNSPHCCPTMARFINDSGQIFGSNNWGNIMATRTSAIWLVGPLGRGSVEAISRGNKVLSRLADGSIAVWTIGGPTVRVSLDDATWTIDALTGINDRAQIIAHGVNKATGQKAALLLDPL